MKEKNEYSWNDMESFEKRMSNSLKRNTAFIDKKLGVDRNFDIVNRNIMIGGKEASTYFINGFCDDDLLQKLLQSFMEIKKNEVTDEIGVMIQQFVPHIQVEIEDKWDKIIYNIMSGVFALFMEGYHSCILIDCRSYPARNVQEPEKDKALRGSKDGFVETVVMNTALIRRRIRSTDLRMEILNAGKSSRTDIVLCYMDSRVDQEFLDVIRNRINALKIDALSMNQESLAECLFRGKWYNPFPKFKYTERPDTASAQILEGNIIILVDNSPSAMIAPTSIFDIVEDADDYYFPPITGSYLRLTRFLISILTYILTPTFLLLTMHEEWIPNSYLFIKVKETMNIPLLWQFLALEIAIDGLKLAAVNTPTMLSTPLSVMAALVLGEFSVKSGWFNAEVMLYMSFVAIANYTQTNYEIGYALKFMRIITLILTALFGLGGYIAGILILILSIVCNRTVSKKSYIYPLFPLNLKRLSKRLLRTRLPETRK